MKLKQRGSDIAYLCESWTVIQPARRKDVKRESCEDFVSVLLYNFAFLPSFLPYKLLQQTVYMLVGLALRKKKKSNYYFYSFFILLVVVALLLFSG